MASVVAPTFSTVSHAQYRIATNGDGTCTILGYTGPGGVVNIPASTNSLTVISIGNNAFKATSITGVTAEEGLALWDRKFWRKGVRFYFSPELLHPRRETAGVAELQLLLRHNPHSC